jgi:hypothetical protein
MDPSHSARRFRAVLGLRQIEEALAPAWEDTFDLLRRLPETDPLHRMAVNNAAKHLHDFYQALESLIFERIIDETQEGRPAPREYHASLLRQMSTSITGLRPAVLSMQLAAELDEFRRFHHVFESVYAPFWDPKKVLPLVAEQPRVLERTLSEIREFLNVMVPSPAG